MAVTANGFIAKQNDNVNWLSSESWKSYQRINKNVGCVIIGRYTYDLMPKEEFLSGVFYAVLTKDKSLEKELPNLWITTKSPREVLEILGQKGYKEVCIAGGGKLNASFVKEGLVDEIYLDIEPIIFGKGTQLFFPEDFEFQLELLEVKKLSKNTVQLHYKVKK